MSLLNATLEFLRDNDNPNGITFDEIFDGPLNCVWSNQEFILKRLMAQLEKGNMVTIIGTEGPWKKYRIDRSDRSERRILENITKNKLYDAVKIFFLTYARQIN